MDAMLSRRRAEGEPDYLREVKNEFMAQWDGIRCLACPSLLQHARHADKDFPRIFVPAQYDLLML